MLNLKLTVKELILFSYLSAIILVLKEVLSFLPNIELVSFFIIIYSLIYRYKAFYITIIYLLIFSLINGFNLWSIPYFFTWLFICLLTNLFFNILKDRYILISIYSAIIGFFFSLFYTISNFILFGFNTAFYYFLSGLPFDVIHMISNFFIMLFIGKFIYTLLLRLNLQ